MPIYLRNSTTAQEVPLGYFVSSTDGDTAVTTVTGSAAYVIRAGQTSLLTITAGIVHISGGFGYVVLDEGHTGINGSGVVISHPTGALAVKTEICVLPQQVYDSMIAGSDNLDINVFQWAGASVTASTLLPVTVRMWDATSVSSSNVAVIDASTRLNANVQQWAGTSATSNNIVLRSEISLSVVNVTAWQGVSVTTANIALWQSVSSANMTQISGDGTAADNLETAFDDTAGAVPWTGVVDQGTAQSAGATTLVLRAAAAFANDEIIGATVHITGGTTGVGQSRVITDYDSASDTATVDTWTTTPSGTVTYKIFASAPASAVNVSPVNVTQWAGTSVTSGNITLWQSVSAVNVTQWAGTSTSASNIALTDFSTRLNANVQAWAGKSVSTSDLAAFSVSQTVLTSATVAGSVDVATWAGATVSASNIATRNTLTKSAQILGFNDISANTVSSVVMATAMTEAYAADGAAGTLPQMLYQIWSRLSEFSISGQTITSFKLDGTTGAMTFSLDSATAPTKVERVS